ncbi:MAG: Ig-like domain-containing protein [Prevotella sp.]|nr:Ig-like domain-containing protein [Prevotella sp.]
MKKIMIWMTTVAAITLFSSCSDVFGLDNNTMVEVRINGEGVSDHALKQELEQTVKLTLNDIASGRDFAAEWQSLDESVATIDENGIVTPIAVGEVKITGQIKNTPIVNGDYVMVTVVYPSLHIHMVDDNLEQSLAE